MAGTFEGPTLQSTIQRLTSPDTLPSQPTHPFASSEETWLALSDIFTSTSRISDSLNAYLSLPLENHKLISLLRQHTAASHSLYLSEQNAHETISLLKAKVGVSYGEDIPLDQTSIVDWCISRLEAWGSSAGMEAFKEKERQGKMTLVLGGKILVMDVDFSVDRGDPLNPRLNIAGFKTSYASPSGGATTDGSIPMNGILSDVLKEFLVEVQKPAEEQDPLKARCLGRTFSAHLEYLMKLDLLASREGDGGMRWFRNIDILALAAEGHAKLEARAVAKSLSVPRTPLDIFLTRSHALPLPYLTSPSLTFLIYTSPLAYLALLRTSRASSVPPPPHAPEFDVPLVLLRSQLSVQPPPPGVTTASLQICDVFRPRLASSVLEYTVARPFFSLHPSMSRFDHVFPEVLEPSTTQDFPGSPRTVWVLDFTHEGKTLGIAMSQSRMREIETIVNPFSQNSGPPPMGMVNPSSLGSGSWVDLVLNPKNPISPERYTSIYTSPTSAYPRLQLRLTAPQEPGFFLERVQVRNIKEVWSILEIVREQCWLNEILSGCKWTAEGLDTSNGQDANDGEQADEEELRAVLSGTYRPRQIPINVYLPSDDPGQALFDQPRLSQSPRIAMTLPERPPISGLVEIDVSLDATRPRGVAVNLSGAMSADLNIEMLEEVCRRGGLFSLPGRVWASSFMS